VLATLDDKLTNIVNNTASWKQTQQEYEKAGQSALKEVLDKQKEKGVPPSRRSTYERENMMDVDEVDNKGKNRK